MSPLRISPSFSIRQFFLLVVGDVAMAMAGHLLSFKDEDDSKGRLAFEVVSEVVETEVEVVADEVDVVEAVAVVVGSDSDSCLEQQGFDHYSTLELGLVVAVGIQADR